MKYANDPLKYWLAIVNTIMKYVKEILNYANDPLKYWLAIVNKMMKYIKGIIDEYVTEIMKYADDPLKYRLTIVNKEIPAKYKALFTLHMNKFLYWPRQCCEVQHYVRRL